MPKLSIITVNLDNVDGLKKTMTSVFSQTCTDFEYIIIDGGSQDSSIDEIQKFSSKITNWVSENDKGIYNAHNKGLARAKGEYVLFLNSGDYFVNASILDYCVPYFDGDDIVYGNLLIQDRYTRWEKKYPDTLDATYFLEESLPHSGAAFIKRSLFDEIGNYDETYKISADVKFYLQAILNKKATTKHIDKPLAVFPLNGLSSLPGSSQILLAERQRILKNFSPEINHPDRIDIGLESVPTIDKADAATGDRVVSIIITCYNSGEFLHEALESLNISTGYVLEIIIVDDGSTDENTLTILDSFDRKNCTVLQQVNKGPAAARNAGIKISSGEYLLFLESCNKIRPNFLSKGIEILKNRKDVGVIYGKPFFFGDDAMPPFHTAPFDKVKILTENYIDICTLMRKSAWIGAGEFDENKSIFGYDHWEYWIRLINTQWKFYFIDEICYDYRVRSASIVTADFDYRKNKEMLDYIFSKHYQVIIKNYNHLNNLHRYEANHPFRTLLKNIWRPFRLKGER